MSKQAIEVQEEKPRVVIPYEEAPLLKELEFVRLLTDWRRVKLLSEKYVVKEKALRDSIASCVRAVGADSVSYKDSLGRDWSVAYVHEVDGEKVDNEKLMLNLGKIGKLDSDTIAAIYAASKVPTSKQAHGKITPPKKEKE